MSGHVFIDGEYYHKDEAKVSVFDHGYLYGDGVFEGIRVYHGHVFRLEEHIDRLYESAKAILLEIPYTKQEMIDVVTETCRRNNIEDGYIRLVVSRGVGDLGLNPKNCHRATVVCIADKIQLYPEEFYEQGLSIITVATRRNSADALNPRIKSLNYLNNILAKIEANIAGKQEVVMLTSEGYVAECTGDNIFIVKNGVLLTPPKHMGILEGITRNVVLELAAQRNIPAREEVFTRHDLYVADECFLTGTAAEIVPVVEIDERMIGDGKPGPMTKRLIDAFREETTRGGHPINP